MAGARRPPAPTTGVWRPPARRLAEPDRLVTLAVALVAFFAYRAVAARYPVEWDGAQLVMALDRFDVTDGTPHAPGNWLYVAVGRIVRAATPLDGTASLTLVSSLAAAGTVGVAHALGRSMGGRRVAAMVAGLVATSPFLWFYAASVDTYTLDALAGVVLAHLAWHARRGSGHGVLATVALGLAAGFRQTSLVLFAPLAVLAMARSATSVRTWLAGAAAGVAAVATWLVPMLVDQPGGWSAWRAAGDAILAGSVEQTSVLSGTAEVVTRNMTQGATYAVVAFLPALVVGGAAVVARLLDGTGGDRTDRDGACTDGDRARTDVGGFDGDRADGTSAGADEDRTEEQPAPRRPWWAGAWALAAVGSLLPLAFLVFVHFGKAGYLLAALPVGVVLLVLPSRSLRGRVSTAVVVVAAAVSLLSAQRFLFAPAIVPSRLVDATPAFVTTSVNGAPFPFTHRTVVDSDRLAEEMLGLRERFDPATDVLVWGWLNGGERYRHATLLLPEITNSFVQESVHLHTARAGRWTTDPDTELEVPPGGRAVFVLDHVPPDLEALLDQGLATPVRLSSGPTVWVVEPGVTLLGVAVVEGDTSV